MISTRENVHWKCLLAKEFKIHMQLEVKTLCSFIECQLMPCCVSVLEKQKSVRDFPRFLDIHCLT